MESLPPCPRSPATLHCATPFDLLALRNFANQRANGSLGSEADLGSRPSQEFIPQQRTWQSAGSTSASCHSRTSKVLSVEARGIARKRRDRHHSLNVGSMHPPQTQGKVQSAVRLALSGMYLLQAFARTGLIDCQMTSKVPEEFILPIMTGLER